MASDQLNLYFMFLVDFIKGRHIDDSSLFKKILFLITYKLQTCGKYLIICK